MEINNFQTHALATLPEVIATGAIDVMVGIWIAFFINLFWTISQFHFIVNHVYHLRV